MIFIGYLVYDKYIKVHSDDDGRIEDQSVTTERVLETLQGFKPKYKSDGTVTEGEIQKQLFSYLIKYYVHVKREHGVEGANALKVDFDIGRGAVGIEVKLAKSLFKSASLHRLIGQMDDYTNNKYNEKNLIILVIGSSEEAKEQVLLSNIEEKIEEAEAEYLFLKIK